jgi:hypothetical protein
VAPLQNIVVVVVVALLSSIPAISAMENAVVQVVQREHVVPHLDCRRSK